MSTKDWPRLMSVTPVAVVGGEDRTALRTGLPFYAMPAHVTDGDALEADEIFLFAPAGHQPDGDGIVTIRAERLAELERDAGRMRWLQRMAAYVGFSADPWLVDPTRIDGAIEDENRPASASEAKRQKVGR